VDGSDVVTLGDVAFCLVSGDTVSCLAVDETHRVEVFIVEVIVDHALDLEWEL